MVRTAIHHTPLRLEVYGARWATGPPDHGREAMIQRSIDVTRVVSAPFPRVASGSY